MLYPFSIELEKKTPKDASALELHCIKSIYPFRHIACTQNALYILIVSFT